MRPCLVPEATVLLPADWNNASLMFKNESGLVRVQTDATKNIAIHVGGHMGAGRPTAATSFKPDQDGSGTWRTNCDLNGDGKVTFSDTNEARLRERVRGRHRVHGVRELPVARRLHDRRAGHGDRDERREGARRRDGGDELRPRHQRGPADHAPSPAMLRYFSGGNQFTMQARCDDDVRFKSGDQPLDSSHACVNQNGNNPEQQ